MVNPLMSSMPTKTEPSPMTHCLEDSGSLVKMELDTLEHVGSDSGSKCIKTELDDLLGLPYCSSSMLIDSDQLHLSDSDSKESLIGGDLLLGPPPSYSGDGLSGSFVRTVKIPALSDAYPPVLSIPGSFMSLGTGSSLEISISPASQGPDTTTLTSPPHHGVHGALRQGGEQRKTTYTAKGAKHCTMFLEETDNLGDEVSVALWAEFMLRLLAWIDLVS